MEQNGQSFHSHDVREEILKELKLNNQLLKEIKESQQKGFAEILKPKSKSHNLKEILGDDY